MLSICLFDAKEGRKLTESFHWEVACDAVSGMIIKPEGPSVSLLSEYNLPEGWIRNPSQVDFL